MVSIISKSNQIWKFINNHLIRDQLNFTYRWLIGHYVVMKVQSCALKDFSSMVYDLILKVYMTAIQKQSKLDVANNRGCCDLTLLFLFIYIPFASFVWFIVYNI